MIFKNYDEERKYLDQVEAWFEEAKDEYLAFDKVEPKRNKRADLHAIVLQSLSVLLKTNTR